MRRRARRQLRYPVSIGPRFAPAVSRVILRVRRDLIPGAIRPPIDPRGAPDRGQAASILAMATPTPGLSVGRTPADRGRQRDGPDHPLPASPVARPGRNPRRKGGDAGRPGLLLPVAFPGHRGRTGAAEGVGVQARRGLSRVSRRSRRNRGIWRSGRRESDLRPPLPRSDPAHAGETITVNFVLADGDDVSMAPSR